jgi:hypothetical protein
MLPLLVVFVPISALVWTVSGSSLFFLALLGALAARAGGSRVWKSVARVTFLESTRDGPHRRGRSIVRSHLLKDFPHPHCPPKKR